MVTIDRSALRVFLYDRIVGGGTIPTVADVAEHFGVGRDAATEFMRNNGLGRTALTHPSGEIWMAGPFANYETPYRVSVGSRQWRANCAWDMFGVAAIVNEPVRIDAICADCDEHISFDLAPHDEHVDARTGGCIVHVLVPARHWYDDIGFT